MSWLQLRITSHSDHVARIEKALSHAQALSITLEDNADQAIFEPALGETPIWAETRITGLFHADINTDAIALQVCNMAKIDEQQAHWHVLEDKDWEREWMSQYHPIQCADNFWICPSWTPPPNPEATNLMLDPGLAFGTGTHPTTFLCLKWLAGQNVKDFDAIDYGCGSGILGIGALLLGARQVCGVDIDPQALLATKDNVLRNDLEPARFPVFFPSKSPSAPSDLVLANILAGPLVELSDTLISLLKRGGKLCLSGVLETQKDSILNAYGHSIDFDETQVKDGWICLTGTRK